MSLLCKKSLLFVLIMKISMYFIIYSDFSYKYNNKYNIKVGPKLILHKSFGIKTICLILSIVRNSARCTFQ